MKTYKVEGQIIKVTIQKVEIIPGEEVLSNWHDDMYKITTDQGVFIRNTREAAGVKPHNWGNNLGQTLFAVKMLARNNKIGKYWLKTIEEQLI